MKFFLVSVDGVPNSFYKASCLDDALRMFGKGMSDTVYYNYTSNASFKVRELKTLEEFLEVVPDEFLIDEDTSF